MVIMDKTKKQGNALLFLCPYKITHKNKMDNSEYLYRDGLPLV